MSSSSASSTSQWIYDVFLSFRGKDTRRKFISHLNDALSSSGIDTYIDDRLESGTELEPKLLQAIQGSRISIVVFSKTYAQSSWCLKELEQIMKYRRNGDQVVLPIFHEVDPSDVRHLTGSFGIDLQDTVKRRFSRGKTLEMENELSNWKSTLNEAANLSGWDSNNFKDEAELVSTVVDDVKRKLKSRLLNITQYPVGLDTRVKDVIQLFENQLNKVCLIGIWGMGGSGKTTIAKVIYNQFHSEFKNGSFIENIREACERGDEGIIRLQEQLLENVLKPNEKIRSTASGITMIEKIFNRKRALIVLDDVSTFEQVEALCGNTKCFGAGSVLIVTSRDLRILRLLEVDHVYSIKEMDEIKSLELFSWHAFRQPSPIEGFNELSRSTVACCGGLPLALEVIGCFLRYRPKQFWESTLSKLRIIPNNKVQMILKISYDGLDDDSGRDMFLDICCFFIGKDRACVSEILDGCELHANIGLTVLIERSLLKVEKNNKLGMHDLLRDMGREIVRQKSEEEAGKRSRLWFHEDAHKVLTENTGTNTVKGLVLKSHNNNNVSYKADSFKEMKNLKLLQLDHVGLTGDYVHLSQKLIWLHWQGFTGDCIPGEFSLANLVVFELKYSNVKQVQSKTKSMVKLKILNLSHSKYLENTPDFSKLPHLEKLVMKDCPSLSELHPSIGDLKNILLINLKDCTSLNYLPEKIYQLKSLKTFILSGCSKIDKLEENIVQMESLTTLIAKDTAIKEVPYSIIRSKSIVYISLCGYEGLSNDVFPSFVWSWMSPTINSLPRISPFGNMALSLASIDVHNNNASLSTMVRSLSQFRTVRVQCSSKIQITQELQRILDDQYDVNFTKSETSNGSQISNLSLRSLLIGMGSCHTVIDTLGKSMSQGLTSNDSSDFFLPSENHPSWLAYTGEGPSAQFQVPEDINSHMKGIILCVVYSSTSENMAIECLTCVLIVNYTKCTVDIYKRDTIMSFNDEDWKNVTTNLGPGDDVKIYVAFGHGLIVKKTIVYLISGQSIIAEVDDAKMEAKPSKEVNVQPSPEVKVKQSRKPNKSILTRLPKRMYASSIRSCDGGLLQILKHEEDDEEHNKGCT